MAVTVTRNDAGSLEVRPQGRDDEDTARRIVEALNAAHKLGGGHLPAVRHPADTSDALAKSMDTRLLPELRRYWADKARQG